ncbi:MAG: TetR/AcrR family transcriptional regulator [Granulosicoccus sp.]|nr:TetR/AcrR family transcriptional regulator [Granulosicoccus sp.]
MGRPNKRELLLDTAEELFVRNGYFATGINEIIEEAGIATMTLYNNFENKDELIVAMIERRADRFKTLFDDYLSSVSSDPYEQILAIFDVVDDLIASEHKSKSGFSGCAFIKASFEFPDSSHPARVAALIQKRDILKLFEKLLKKAGYTKTRERALELHILFDGAITQAQMLGNKNSAKRSRSMAERLLSLN